MILLVTDNQDTGDVWCRLISQRVDNVILIDITCITGNYIPQEEPLLIVVDVYSSQLDIKQLIEGLRIRTTRPILLLIAGHDNNQILKAYKAGIDDYIGKPFDPLLLLAKVEVWLRRAAVVANFRVTEGILKVGNVGIELNRKVWISESGVQTKLTNLEFKLLSLLLRHPNKVIELSAIVRQVWGYTEGNEELVKHLVYRIRRKIETKPDDPRYIIKVFGRGYKFVPP